MKKLLALVFFIAVSAFAGDLSPECEVAFDDIVQRAVEQIAYSKGAPTPGEMIPVVALQQSLARMEELAKWQDAQFEAIEKWREEAKACNKKAVCLRTAAQKALVYMRTGWSNLRTLLFAESRARRSLAAEHEKMAQEWVDGNSAALAELPVDQMDPEVVRAAIAEELAAEFRSPVAPRNAMLLPMVVGKAVKDKFKDAMRALVRGRLMGIKKARIDFLKTLTTVLTFQVVGHAITVGIDLAQGKEVNPLLMSWVYLNTACMIYIQKKIVAAEILDQKEPDKDFLELNHPRDVLLKSPHIVLGPKGFWSGGTATYLAIAASFPIEILISVAAKVVNNQFVPSSLNLGQVVAVQGIAVGFVYLFYGVQWAFWDPWFNLRFLGNVRETDDRKIYSTAQALAERFGDFQGPLLQMLAHPEDKEGTPSPELETAIRVLYDFACSVRPSDADTQLARDQFISAYRRGRWHRRLDWTYRVFMQTANAALFFTVVKNIPGWLGLSEDALKLAEPK